MSKIFMYFIYSYIYICMYSCRRTWQNNIVHFFWRILLENNFLFFNRSRCRYLLFIFFPFFIFPLFFYFFENLKLFVWNEVEALSSLQTDIRFLLSQFVPRITYVDISVPTLFYDGPFFPRTADDLWKPAMLRRKRITIAVIWTVSFG